MIHEVDYYPHFTDEETKALRSLVTYKQLGAELAFKPVCLTSEFISSPSSIMILDIFLIFYWFLIVLVPVAAQAFSRCGSRGCSPSCGLWASHCGGSLVVKRGV